MQLKTDKGNVVIEFLIYILVTLSFIGLFIDFFQISRNLNEMGKLANFVSINVAQNPKNIEQWSTSEVRNKLLSSLDSNLFNYSIMCGPTNCLSNPDYVTVSVTGDSSILSVKVPLSVSKKATASKFLSK
jgi:hypothetical protein